MACAVKSPSAPVGTASTVALAQSEASSATPSTTDCASSPATTSTSTVDTPFETEDDAVRNGEKDHEHDGVSTPRKPGPHHGVMEDHAQLHKLQTKLIELERRAERETAARQQLEVQLRDEVIPAASGGFARSLSGVGYLTGPFRDAREDRGRLWETYRDHYNLKTRPDDSIGQVTRLTIEILERELSSLRSDLKNMTEVEQDRERLRSMEALWEQEKTSLLQKQRKLELIANETKPDPATVPTDQPVTDPPVTEAATDLAQHIEIPDLNLVRWLSFRLCLSNAPADSFAIDVLDGEPEISFERPRFYSMWSHSKAAETVRPRANMIKTSEQVQDRGQKPISERIRINSKHILRILSKIRGEPLTSDDDSPLVMTRPYKALDYWSEAIRAKFRQLESKFSPSEAQSASTESKDTTLAIPGDATQASESPPITGVSTGEKSQSDDAPEGEEDDDEWTNSMTAYRHLKCLIRFMDDQLLGKAKFLESDRCRTVAFTDVWYLFKPGDEVVDQSLRQVYRVIGITSPGHQVFPPWRSRWDKDAKAKEETPIYLHCVYIDFDGKQLGPILRKVRIPRYDSEKTVTSLEVFPLRFAEDKISALASKIGSGSGKTLQQRLIERGKLFMDMTGFKHMRYNGVALDTRDEVDSNVVVDFQEAFSFFQQDQKNQSQKKRVENESGELIEVRNVRDDWVPKLRTLIGMPMEPDFEDEDCTSECCRGAAESYFKDGFAEKKRNQDYMQSLMPEGRDDPPPSIYTRPLREIKLQENALTDGDYLIMSYRVFGFILRSRKWAQLDLNNISLPDTSPANKARAGKNNKGGEEKGSTEATQGDTGGEGDVDDDKPKGDVDNGKLKGEHGSGQEVEDEDDSAFGQLVLPEGHKTMVKSLVAQHFRDKESQEERQADIISGKGKGLIILLHGAPGVGKTTTAEGVAQMFGKPLYQITCGDLGTTATEVEKALETSFNLASRWGCVLLLDEADVFLAERSRLDFTRNGLVSVFLRVLEYYTGVLFLTTNRIGDFDEAFASRIHISLYYPQLDIDSTLSIFNLNLDMIDGNYRKGEIEIDRDGIIEFATKYFHSQKDARWNGRQIRNACHTALALAEFRAQGGSHKKAIRGAVIYLKVDDLEIVSNAYLEFMKYLTEVHDKKGFEMWAKSVNIRAKEEDFARKIAKMYEDMNQHKAINEQQNQPSKHGPLQAPGQGASDPTTNLPAHAAAPAGTGWTNGAISHEQPVTQSTPSVASPGPRSSGPAPSAEQPHPQQQPPPPAFDPAQGYPPPGAWPGYYQHPGGYAQPPQGNPAGPPPLAPQPYQPWQNDPRYAQYPPMQPPQAPPQQQPPYYNNAPGGHVGPYPPPPPPPAS
ncbi:hypothetical protein BGZ57DRAFT_975572 [Hyaloscypha finlandica]|nr:hypothetical protein BGZ57DRAFT_975572 [Hyaloscypha finlandica]